MVCQLTELQLICHSHWRVDSCSLGGGANHQYGRVLSAGVQHCIQHESIHLSTCRDIYGEDVLGVLYGKDWYIWDQGVYAKKDTLLSCFHSPQRTPSI